MLRVAIIFLEMILAYLLQSSVFIHFQLAGIVPDVLLVLVCSVSYTSGRMSGLLTGFFSGLIIDCTYGSCIGLFALIYMTLGYACGYANKIYKPESYTFPFFLIGAAEFLYNIAYYFFFMLLKGKLNFGFYLVNNIIPKVIYTVIVSLLIYRLINLQNLYLEELPYKKLHNKKASTNGNLKNFS